MNIITQEQLKSLTGGQAISGIVLIKDYSVQLTRNGAEYITGTLQSGVDKPFKAWNNSGAFSSLKNAEYSNVPSYIVGSGDDYGGQISIVLSSVQAVDGYTPDQFFPLKYNIDAYWETLKKLVSAEVTPKGMKFCNDILFENEAVAGRFKVEFAAKSHHDNCKGGLLAHTYKVTSLVSSVMAQYPAITTRSGVQDPDLRDLLYIGALLHDIGKIYEMEFGSYKQCSVVKHQYLGVELISQFKPALVEAYGEEWYYNLISIILQHHGEWGEPPKTVWAQIVHYIDVYEAKMTDIMQAIDAVDGVGKVKIDGATLDI